MNVPILASHSRNVKRPLSRTAILPLSLSFEGSPQVDG